MSRIERDIYFFAGIHLEHKFVINAYSLSLSMLIETESTDEHVIALNRMDHFINNVLSNSVFVNQKDLRVIEKYYNAGIDVCFLPDDPYDQVLGLVLLRKLNAIMEDRLKITDMTITSSLNENIRFPIVAEAAENTNYLRGDYWWNKSNTTINNESVLTQETDNIIRLFGDNVWASLDLDWKQSAKK